ncbi:hypothetical protein W97_03927 [Coniosporium apollinis CBS 100218]|uniref:peptidyl-tRNA hydrolase n=1 Tax=Coniosporium apollinis (strain CBS 100218) TaxID=1168221 RepID=R7YSA5_CONA1|nr:uncharacterized protein W97_03927 [Coniosporium apollinis CBS 100218]EON64694.1 hypothetical protein W97_03927 [Coniosporium apollinis CBS 100218]
MSSLQERPPPTTASIAFGTAIIAAIIGYFLGQASSIGVFGGAKASVVKAVQHTQSAESSSSEEVDELLDEQQELRDFPGSKIAAQCSHATLACYKTFLRQNPDSPILKRWERYGQMKVALQVKNEEELEMLQAQAVSLGMCAQVIHDAGRTQIASGSATVLGIGPAPKSMVDQVTGHLKLL